MLRHESDLIAALYTDPGFRDGSTVFEPVYFDLVHSADFFVVIDILDLARSGFLTAVLLGSFKVHMVTSQTQSDTSGHRRHYEGSEVEEGG